MKKLVLGILLIMMMFGHNYVLNQPQILQAEFQQIHDISVTQFNLLYSLPSAVCIFFILPIGVMYDKHSEVILIGSALVLALGQGLVAIFGNKPTTFGFEILVTGRVMEGTAAEILYMIQANLSSTWMGKLAGLVLILPQVGQVINVFLTLWIREHFGIQWALSIGFLTCFASFLACFFLYRHLKQYKKIRNTSHLMSSEQESKNQAQKDMFENDEDKDEKEMKTIQSSKTTKTNSEQFESPNLIENKKNEIKDEKLSIFKAGKIFWMVVGLCAINECLYFPFLDNAKILIQTRFCVPSSKTAFYLCLPYLSAIIVSVIVGQKMLYKFSREKLIFASSFLPLMGHLIIYLIANCEKETTYFQQIFLVLGFVLFGTGIAGYYSVSLPAVGLCVPESIRGSAFAVLGFLSTLTMTAVPLISGQIIEQDSTNYNRGYADSSFLFVCLCLSASVVSFFIMLQADSESFKYVEQQNENEEVDQGSKLQQIE